MRALADRARAGVAPAPTLGIPDVSALGEVPGDPTELTAYLGRLERVDRALTVAQTTYAAALARRDDLAERAEKVRDALSGDAAASMAPLVEQARTLLDARPTDLVRLEALVQAQETFARTMGASR